MTAPLRILAIGAHPDDCEWACGGTAARWTSRGDHVRFVSLTNGELGHWKKEQVGAPLAKRRKSEALRAAQILGTDPLVLDIPDGTLTASLELRTSVVRLIREWKADVVLSHRPNDYHPDHRAAGALLQDAAYLVTIPHYCPEAPALERNPLFLHFEDEFTRPQPFQADVVVPIDDVWERKLAALEAMESQGYEGGCEGHEGLWPSDEPGRARRIAEVRENYRRFFENRTRRRRLDPAVRFAEAFEICEYSQSWADFSKTSRAADPAELRRLFPL